LIRAYPYRDGLFSIKKNKTPYWPFKTFRGVTIKELNILPKAKFLFIL